MTTKTIAPATKKFKSLFDDLTELGFTCEIDESIIRISRAGDEKAIYTGTPYVNPKLVRTILSDLLGVKI